MKHDWMRGFAWGLVGLGVLIWILGLVMFFGQVTRPYTPMDVFVDAMMLGAGPFALGVLLLAIRRPAPREAKPRRPFWPKRAAPTAPLQPIPRGTVAAPPPWEKKT